MTRYLPRGLILEKLKQRFERLNPNGEWDDVDTDSLDYPCEYDEALEDFANNPLNSCFKWYEDNDLYQVKLSREDMEQLGLEEEIEKQVKNVRIELKLYFQKSKKGDTYAYVKGTIGKKLFKKYGKRLCEELIVNWPLYEIVKDEQELDAPNALFDEKKVEEEEEHQDAPNVLFDSVKEKKTKEDEDEERSAKNPLV